MLISTRHNEKSLCVYSKKNLNIQKKQFNNCFFLVLMIGLEPIRYCYRGILSPLRLPIPPHQHMEVPPRFELGIRVLQTRALPLGEGTIWQTFKFAFPSVVFVLTYKTKMERKTRFELATFALARQRSTTEPLPQNCTLLLYI